MSPPGRSMRDTNRQTGNRKGGELMRFLSLFCLLDVSQDLIFEMGSPSSGSAVISPSTPRACVPPSPQTSSSRKQVRK